MSNRANFQTVLLLVGLTLASFLVRAEVYTTKNWVVNTDNDKFYFTASSNEAAHLLGQYCYIAPETCYYTVAFNITCKKGESYPVLVSTELGAEHMNAVCSNTSGSPHLLVLDNFAVIDRLVRNASRIGFAMPLNNDQFKISRFDLTGAAHAIDLMRGAAEKKAGAVFKRGRLPAEALM